MDNKKYIGLEKICISLFLIGAIGEFIIQKIVINEGLANILSLELRLLQPAVYILLAVAICKKRKIELYSTFLVSKLTMLKRYLKGFLSGGIIFSITVGILYVTGNASLDTESIQPVGIVAIPIVLFILSGWMVQSAGEEFLIRGLFMKLMSKKFNIFLAVFLSSIIFSAMHLGNPGITIIAIVNLILYGVAMGLYVVKTNDLIGACGNHAAWNFFQGNIFGFEVSGLDVVSGTIMDFKAIGNSTLNGGEFGPEAGLVCTLVLIVFSIIMLIKILNERRISNLNNVN